MIHLLWKSKLETINDLPQSKVRIGQRSTNKILSFAGSFVVLQHALKITEKLGYACFTEVGGFLQRLVFLLCYVGSASMHEYDDVEILPS